MAETGIFLTVSVPSYIQELGLQTFENGPFLAHLNIFILFHQTGSEIHTDTDTHTHTHTQMNTTHTNIQIYKYTNIQIRTYEQLGGGNWTT